MTSELKRSLCFLVEDDTIVFGLEPLHGVVLDQSVGESDGSCAPLLLEDVHAWPTQHNIEVHTVDADVGVVLDAKIDVLLDTKSKVALVREVLTAQFELTDLEAPLEDLFCLRSPDSAVNRDLLVSPDSETNGRCIWPWRRRGSDRSKILAPCQHESAYHQTRPTQMLMHNLRILMSRMGLASFFFLSAVIFASYRCDGQPEKAHVLCVAH